MNHRLSTLWILFLSAILAFSAVNCDGAQDLADDEVTEGSTEESTDGNGNNNGNNNDNDDSGEDGLVGAIVTVYCDLGDLVGCVVLDLEDPSSIEETVAQTACTTATGTLVNSCSADVGVCSGLEFAGYTVDYYYDSGFDFLWEAGCDLGGGTWQ